MFEPPYTHVHQVEHTAPTTKLSPTAPESRPVRGLLKPCTVPVLGNTISAHDGIAL